MHLLLILKWVSIWPIMMRELSRNCKGILADISLEEDALTHMLVMIAFISQLPIMMLEWEQFC